MNLHEIRVMNYIFRGTLELEFVNGIMISAHKVFGVIFMRRSEVNKLIE